MYKVLLVDDEQFVRKGLMSLIDWDGCGYEVIAEAGNGEDALQVIMDCQPDLVITDIRMPVTDGLELIQNVSQSNEITPKFVIVSGYNDFKYAQQALRFGVSDFILKPIDKDELEVTLLRLAASMTEEKQESELQKQMALESLFQQVLCDQSQPIFTPALQTILRMSQTPSSHWYLIMEVNGVTKDTTHTEQIKQILGEVTKFVCRTNYHVFLYEIKTGVFGTFINTNDLKPYRNQISLLVENLFKAIQEATDEEISIYIGKEILQITELKTAFCTANEAMRYKYMQPVKNPIFYHEVEGINLNYAELDVALFNQLMEQLEENQPEKFCTIIDEIFHDFKAKAFAPEAVSTSINRCIHCVIGKIKDIDGDIASLQLLDEMIDWKSFNWSIPQLKKKFKHFMIEAAELIIKHRKENSKGDIYKVKAYIEANYRENISLKSIANTFFMNPVYMGQLFKKTYGMYFKEYVLNLRLTEARKLLRQTNKRVYEIAEEVGFGSTDYFVTQFEKMEGTTPTEYRNQILNSSKVGRVIEEIL
ncbi:response regulator transcription factor [Bacillus sp. PS06]|uniref:response regulator transcription factor n=1 Tax=Bacillus sp. PS06 TaxID=2764176 RepID=UPI0017875FF2|nr:response regulator transcription factor [Bacillus sp. PS06]MBD8069067.1 response regulator transcription factor [Bacillus sp. PS06]